MRTASALFLKNWLLNLRNISISRRQDGVTAPPNPRWFDGMKDLWVDMSWCEVPMTGGMYMYVVAVEAFNASFSPSIGDTADLIAESIGVTVTVTLYLCKLPMLSVCKKMYHNLSFLVGDLSDSRAWNE